MSIQQALSDALEARGVTQEQFSELMIRLLGFGVLCRDESKKEAELYDRYLQIKELVEDYLGILHIRISHEPRFYSVRLFPPGADVPSMPDEDSAFESGLRRRLTQQEVALILILRAEYDKALREGQVDEQGQASLPMEALNLASKNLLKRPLPEHKSERELLFRRMRQMRLIKKASDADLDETESWIIIRPDIMSLVTDTVLSQLKDGVIAALPEQANKESESELFSDEEQ